MTIWEQSHYEDFRLFTKYLKIDNNRPWDFPTNIQEKSNFIVRLQFSLTFHKSSQTRKLSQIASDIKHTVSVLDGNPEIGHFL